MKKKKVLVAACLSGEPCRYHGRAVPPRQKLIDRLQKTHQIIYVCPEQLGGLPTPRPPSRWQEGDKLIAGGKDVTRNYRNGAIKTLEIAKRSGAEKFYGVKGSPSCDRDCGMTCTLLQVYGLKTPSA